MSDIPTRGQLEKLITENAAEIKEIKRVLEEMQSTKEVKKCLNKSS